MHSVNKIDMTKGPLMKLVLLFALPLCLGNVLQQLYSTVDTLVIGNFCGSLSLAAVGTSSQPVEFLLCVFMGLGTGVSILISQYTGKGDRESLKRTISTATLFLYLSALPLSLLGLWIGPLLLKAMQTPADTFDLASQYICIIFLGTLGNMGYNLNAGILRGLGDSRSSLIFLLIACGVNIVLDLIFVAGFGMDVSGAALATVLAMFSSWFFSIFYMYKKYPELEFSVFPRKLDKEILLKIIGIGLPLGLNNSIYSIGHILMQSLINAQGSVFMAACSVATKVTGLANMAINSLASAATTFAGQNLGAKNYQRLRKGAWRIPLASFLITMTAALVVTIFCRPILHLFTNDAEVLEIAALYIWVVLPSISLFAAFHCIICFVNGIGIVRYPTVVNILMLWAVRIPTAYLISTFINGTYIMACFPISFSFGLLAMLAFFCTSRWKEIRRLGAGKI